MVKNLPAIAGNTREAGSIPGLGKSPGVGNSNALQYSCLENPIDRGAWQAIIHRVAKSQTGLKQSTIHTHTALFFTMKIHKLKGSKYSAPDHQGLGTVSISF